MSRNSISPLPEPEAGQEDAPLVDASAAAPTTAETAAAAASTGDSASRPRAPTTTTAKTLERPIATGEKNHGQGCCVSFRGWFKDGYMNLHRKVWSSVGFTVLFMLALACFIAVTGAILDAAQFANSENPDSPLEALKFFLLYQSVTFYVVAAVCLGSTVYMYLAMTVILKDGKSFWVAKSSHDMLQSLLAGCRSGSIMVSYCWTYFPGLPAGKIPTKAGARNPLPASNRCNYSLHQAVQKHCGSGAVIKKLLSQSSGSGGALAMALPRKVAKMIPQCWLDIDFMFPGANIKELCSSAVANSKLTLAFITPAYLSSANCITEMQAMVKKTSGSILVFVHPPELLDALTHHSQFEGAATPNAATRDHLIKAFVSQTNLTPEERSAQNA